MAIATEPCQHATSDGAAGQSAKRIAFLTVSLSGHRRLAVSLAMEMADRGFEVDFLVSAAGATEELRTMDREAPNFTLHSITKGSDLISRMDWQRVAASPGRLGGSKLALFQCIDEICEDIEGSVEHWKEMVEILSATWPDVVVLDHAHKVLQQFAEDNGIPTIVLHTPYFQTGPPTGCACVSSEDARKLDEFVAVRQPFKKMDKAKDILGIKGKDIDLGEGEEGAQEARGLAPHTFVFCEPELLHSEHLPPRVHAVGPCFSNRDPVDVDTHLLPWLDDAALAGEKVLYVAFGTLANGFLTASAVGTLLDAFESLGETWRVLWSLPLAQQPLLAQSGRRLDERRVHVETFVRQRAVLAHPAVSVFLSHGGQSSANEGISAGCPLVCMPLFCDQYEMAESLHRHGLGVIFHKDELLDGQAQRLCQLVLRAQEEPHFRATARRHAQLMRIRGGCRRAAEVIESIAFAGADFGELWQGGEVEAEDAKEMLAPNKTDEAPGLAMAPARTLLQQPAAMVKSQLRRLAQGEAAQGGNAS